MKDGPGVDRLGLVLLLLSLLMPWGIFVILAVGVQDLEIYLFLASQLLGVACGTTAFVQLIGRYPPAA